MRYLLLALVLSCLTSTALAQHDYKVSRKHLRDGEFDKAVEVLKQRIEKSPQDSEWVYQLAIAQAGQGNLEAADASVKRALEMGVSRGRFAADAHHLFKPLVKTKDFASLLESVKNRAIQGPMLGNVTESSASIWLRTAGPRKVQVFYNDKAGAKAVPSTMVETTHESDYTAVVTIDGLAAETMYSYQVFIDGQTDKSRLPASFVTASAKGKATKFAFAFGGGAGYVPEHEVMWDTIGSYSPNALFLLGDNMYSDDPKSREMQKFCYYRRQSPNEFRALVMSTPVYSIWDDHDFGTNDCSGGPAVDTPDWKIPVWNVYRQNWVNPGYGGGEKRPGCWYDFYRGDIHFIMLDGRYYRDHPNGTMLGPDQKRWLKQTLEKSQATFRVIASPVPWEYRTKGNSKDTWNGFKNERKEIFDFLAEKKIGGVLLISADRHRTDAWKIERENGYALYEFNSSRLTNNHVHGTMSAAIFSYNKRQSFGLVTIDTRAKDPTITYDAINIVGEKVHSMTLKRSDLK